MPDVIAPEILTALKQLDERKSKLLDLQEAVEVARETQRRFPKIIMGPPKIVAMEKTGWADIMLLAACKSISQLQPVLAFLADNGFRQSDKPRDVPEMHMRAWRCGAIDVLTMIGAGSAPDDDDGKHCRYVEIGKKEIPIYELQCDEDRPDSVASLPGV